jgi:site-specific DNA-methyltransferase (adenine-specific)
MKNIPDKSIDMILCDLPYGTTNCKWDAIIPFTPLWENYNRIIKTGGAMVLFGCQPFTTKLIDSNIKNFKYTLVWKKSKCGSPLLAKYRPMIKHEDIMIFGKGKTKYNPQMKEGSPYKREWTPNKTNNMKFGILGVETNNTGTRFPDSILDFPQKWRRQDQVHPTQKPVDLLEYLIKTYSNENDLILDNCAGSGSTLVAAKNTNRNFIGIEKEEKYYNICLERLSRKDIDMSPNNGKIA